MASVSSRLCRINYFGRLLLAGALLFAVYVRVRLRDFPLERDEGEFAYAGQLLLQGTPPYKFAYSMKLPGASIVYAALMPVFGQSAAGIHLGLLAVNLATILLLYRLTAELFDRFSAGMAALSYAIVSASPTVLGTAAHATHFVAFFGLAGSLLLWRRLQSGGAWQVFAAGLLLGTAFLMKQQAAFLIAFGGLVLLWHGLTTTAYPRKRLPGEPALYSLAAVLPYGLVCFWLWQAGTWEKFWFWTVEYASNYVRSVPLSQAGGYLWENGGDIVRSNWPLGLLALLGFAGLAVPGRAKPGARPFLLAFAIFTFLCVCPGFYFRGHYFIVVLPAAAMFVGDGSRLLWDLACRQPKASAAESPPVPEAAPAPPVAPITSEDEEAQAEVAYEDGVEAAGIQQAPPPPKARCPAWPALAICALLAAVIGTLWLQRDFFFAWDPQQACRIIYTGNPFVEARAIADYLRKNTSADDSIAVLGSEPEIFFSARRRSATGYIYTYGLMEDQPLALAMQKEMIAEIEAAKPKYIVFANVDSSWLASPTSEKEILHWSNKYLDESYRLAGIVEPRPQAEAARLWDDQARAYRPPEPADDPISTWRLAGFSSEPDMPDYSRMPYLGVWRRK